MGESDKIRKRPDEVIKDRQLNELQSLRLYARSLHKSADELIKKIDANGLAGYFSINHDCLRYAERVWRSSLRLCELRRLQDDILSGKLENSVSTDAAGRPENEGEKIADAETTDVPKHSVEVSGSAGKA